MWCATVFIDHFSQLSYVYLQRSTSGEETLKAKQAFEVYARSHGIMIKHYHANNGCFVDPLLVDHCKANSQSMSHSGVNAHFQNSIAEKRIRDLQDATHTMLVHAKHHWPSTINAHLWPYALHTANNIHANTPRADADGQAPIEVFSAGAAAASPRHYHPFGCPIYMLNDECSQELRA